MSSVCFCFCWWLSSNFLILTSTPDWTYCKGCAYLLLRALWKPSFRSVGTPSIVRGIKKNFTCFSKCFTCWLKTSVHLITLIQVMVSLLLAPSYFQVYFHHYWRYFCDTRILCVRVVRKDNKCTIFLFIYWFFFSFWTNKWSANLFIL